MYLTTELDEHQKQGVHFLLKRHTALLDFYTGSGKTLIIALTSFIVLQKQNIEKVIIFATKSALLSFKSDFADNTDYLPSIITTKADLFSFLESKDKGIAVVNYNIITDHCLISTPDFFNSKVLTFLDPKLFELLDATKVAVFFDEFHTLKNPSADITIYMSQLRPLFDRAFGLTATPYTKDLYDYFYLINFLFPKFFPTKKAFTETFVEVEMQEVYSATKSCLIPVIKSYKNLELLAGYVKDIRMFYKPDLDLHYLPEYCNLANRDAYVDVARNKYTLATKHLPVDERKVASFMSKLVDLQTQVDMDGAKHALLRKAIKPYVKDFGVLIYCSYEETVKQVKLALSTFEGNPDIMVIDGATSLKKREQIKNSFKADPKNKIIIITPAGGQSLNLQATNRIFFYNTPFDPGSFIQASGRVVRQYSKHSSFYVHFLLMADTIDVYKYDRLMSQLTVIDQSKGLGVLDISAPSFNQEMLKVLRNKYLWQPAKKLKQPPPSLSLLPNGVKVKVNPKTIDKQ